MSGVVDKSGLAVEKKLLPEVRTIAPFQDQSADELLALSISLSLNSFYTGQSFERFRCCLQIPINTLMLSSTEHTENG